MDPDIAIALIQIARQFGDLPADSVAAVFLAVAHRYPDLGPAELHTETARQLHQHRQHTVSPADWDDADLDPWRRALGDAHRQAEADLAAALVSAVLHADGHLSQADIDLALGL